MRLAHLSLLLSTAWIFCVCLVESRSNERTLLGNFRKPHRSRNSEHDDNQSLCSMPPVMGRCRGYFQRWFYNASSEQCETFVYGGCHGNQNRFMTLEECEDRCPDLPEIEPKMNDAPSSCNGAALCFKKCPSGFRKDHDGCPLCECKEDEYEAEKCPLMSCFLACEYGFQEDDQGCPMCACKAPPGMEGEVGKCVPVMCLMFCVNGFAKDENGCEICQCKEANYTSEGLPKCPGIHCRRYCEYGFKKDDLGCDTCKCNDKPEKEKPSSSCSGVRRRCPGTCEHGYEIDSKGCNTCSCKKHPDTKPEPETTVKHQTKEKIHHVKTTPSINNRHRKPDPSVPHPHKHRCGPLLCGLYCEHGYQRNEEGCEICQCQDSMKDLCPPTMCMMYCEHGFVRDKNGCETCICIEEPTDTCPPFLCYKFCEYGYVEDKNGCKVCKCNEGPPQGVQPYRPKHSADRECSGNMCHKYCKHGFQVDTKGCEICECRPNPTHKPLCPFVACKGKCEGGFIVDKNGCQTCECQEVSTITHATDCPLVMCMMHCEHGFKQDENGCDICSCRSADDDAPPRKRICPFRRCVGRCNNGFKKDDNGCPICVCEEAEVDFPASKQVCAPLSKHCALQCPHGMSRDGNGCELCRCKLPGEQDGEKEQLIEVEESEDVLQQLNDICLKPLDSGPCEDRIQRYYYNAKTGKCERFTYSGCGGNQNNFREERHCVHTCIERRTHRSDEQESGTKGEEEQEEDWDNITHLDKICSRPLDAGPCEDAIERFYYNKALDRCETFVYTGCGGNQNNFQEEEHCNHSCIDQRPHRRRPSKRKSRSRDLHANPNQMDGGEKLEKLEELCRLPVERGNCDSAVPRYHFNEETGKCERFSYSGCGGNLNNFHGKKRCFHTCVKKRWKLERRQVRTFVRKSRRQ